MNRWTQGRSRRPTTDAKERLDEEGELEGWMARNSAMAMAKIVAAIHQILIPSLFKGIPPFRATIEVRWHPDLPYIKEQY